MNAFAYRPLAGMVLLACAGPAAACADIDCSPPLTLQLQAEQCGLTGLPFLSPDNDTRITLALLAREQGLTTLAAADSDGKTQPLAVPFAVSDLAAPESAAASADWLAQAQALGVDPTVLQAAQQRADGWLEGRCALNRPAAASAFLQALSQAGLSTEEARALAEARLVLLGQCQADGLPDYAALPTSAAAAPYRDYLLAARAFYLGDFAEAQTRFAALSQQGSAWPQQTALYMLARVAINAAQANALDEYGFFDPTKVDALQASEAAQALDRYLAAYPQGQYAASAKGLYRRVHWLAGDGAQLTADYQQALAAPQDMTLWNEIDLKLLADGKGSADPRLLLAQDLRRLRPHVEGETRWEPLTAEELATQQAALTPAAWFDYLQLAQRFYVAKEYAAVAATAPLPAGQSLDLLTFSRQVLRGMALMALQQWPAAETHWQQLAAAHPDALQQQLIELAQALTLERAGKVAQLFAADSPVTRPALRDLLLRFSAPAPLLRQVAQNGQLPTELRNTALFTLLYKDLQHGQYRDFVTDWALLQPALGTTPFDLAPFSQGARSEEGYACPALADTVATLAKQPTAQARNCLGEFIYRQGWDESPLGAKPGATLLGGAAEPFAGAAQGRLALYRQVIADAKAPQDERSYALFRAVNCFATSGYNHCGSEEIPKAERQRWFLTLKKQYAQSPWAQQQKYYW